MRKTLLIWVTAVVDTTETNAPPTTITVSIYGADDDDLIYSLTTTSPILAKDLASEIRSLELADLVREEARSAKIIQDAEVAFDFKIAEKEVVDDNHLSVTIKAPNLRPPAPNMKDVTPVRIVVSRISRWFLQVI